MSPLAVAAVWAGAGLAGGAVRPPLRLRRLALVVPLAGLVVVLTVSIASAAVPGGAPPGELGLDPVARGLVAAAAGSLAATLVLAPSLDAAQVRTMGLAVAGVVVALATGSAVLWAVALVGSLCVLALRWIAVSPGRTTFAAGRVAVGGGAALLGAAPFLPIAGVLTGPRPVLVSGLLACGIAALAGLLPLGGWAIGTLSTLSAADSAVWPLLLAPAVLLSAERLPAQLPPLALVYFDGIITVLGLASALWQSIQALRSASGQSRYARVYLADVALAAAAIGTGHAPQALPALLLIVVTHLTTAPLLLQDAQASPRLRRLAWLLLCGLPPGPSFWGRLAVIEALSDASFWGMVAALAALAMVFLATLRPTLHPESRRAAATPHRLPALLTRSAGWCVFAGCLTAGLAPAASLALVFGVH